MFRLSFCLFLLAKAIHCEEEVDCPLCADPTHFPQDPVSRFVAGDQTLTCQSAYDLGTLKLPEENCTFWQSRGELICQCAAEAPTPNSCTLCEDSVLPSPLQEAIPGKTCTEVQVDARRNNPELCVVYQQTIGVYCGCDNPVSTADDQEVCRLCGDSRELPDPLAEVSFITAAGETSNTSCLELEFAANIPPADCEEFQLLYRESCCTEEGKEPETSATARIGILIESISAAWIPIFVVGQMLW